MYFFFPRNRVRDNAQATFAMQNEYIPEKIVNIMRMEMILHSIATTKSAMI
jgi:hypothetical protein